MKIRLACFSVGGRRQIITRNNAGNVSEVSTGGRVRTALLALNLGLQVRTGGDQVVRPRATEFAVVELVAVCLGRQSSGETEQEGKHDGGQHLQLPHKVTTEYIDVLFICIYTCKISKYTENSKIKIIQTDPTIKVAGL